MSLNRDCTVQKVDKYRNVASSNKSHLEAHAGIYRLLMKGIFDPYFDKKLIFELVTRDFMAASAYTGCPREDVQT